MATPRGAEHRDLEERFKALEEQVAALTAQSLRQRQLSVSEGDFVVSGGGGVVVRDGGFVNVEHPDSPEGGVWLGRTEYAGVERGVGLLVQQADGTDVARLGTDVLGGGQINLKDKQGNIIVSDDGVSGYGLATPHLELPLYEVPASQGRVVDTVDWTKCYEGQFESRSPYLAIRVAAIAGNGNAGRVRILINGVVATDGGAQDFTSSTFLGWRIPLHNQYEFNSLNTLTIECRRVGAGTTVAVRPERVAFGQS